MAKTILDIIHDEDVEHSKMGRGYVVDYSDYDNDDESVGYWRRLWAAQKEEQTRMEKAASLARSLVKGMKNDDEVNDAINEIDKDICPVNIPFCELKRNDIVQGWHDEIADMISGRLLSKRLEDGYWHYTIEPFDGHIAAFESSTAVRDENYV